jgi:hypothetical protein
MTTPAIIGERFRYIDNGGACPSFWIYVVTVVGGPYDGEQTLAGNTDRVLIGTCWYLLRDDGRFHYAPDQHSTN